MKNNDERRTGGVRTICPVCSAAVSDDTDGMSCVACGRRYGKSPVGYHDFLVTEGFAGADDPERGVLEERAQEVCMQGYLIPLLRRLFKGVPPGQVSVLDVGCGIGKSVDLLCEAGFDAWGADSGERKSFWDRRSHPEKLYLASGDGLPFGDDSFDFVFSAGVIEHVGCDGDARSPSVGYEKKRLDFIRDTVRVTKGGGYLNYTCPNRRFPFDLFHRDNEFNPFRFHWPWDPFLLNMADFNRFFVDRCGCRGIRALPIKGYWGGTRLKGTAAGRAGLKLAGLWFDTFGSWPVFRSSFMNPWLSVLSLK